MELSFALQRKEWLIDEIHNFINRLKLKYQVLPNFLSPIILRFDMFLASDIYKLFLSQFVEEHKKCSLNFLMEF